MSPPPGPPSVPLTAEHHALVESALPLVDVLANRRRRGAPGIALDDLRAVGRAKLVEVIPAYDREKGPLDNFVASYVRGAMLDFIRQTLETHRRERTIAGGLEPDQEPAEETIEQALTATPESDHARVIDALELAVTGGYIASALSSEGEDDVLDKIQMARGGEALRRFSADLSSVERVVFEGFYRDGRSAEALSSEVGVPRRSVARMIERLRELARKTLLDEGVIPKHPI